MGFAQALLSLSLGPPVGMVVGKALSGHAGRTCWRAGCIMRINGLTAAPDLNDRHATLLRENQATGRWEVQVDGTELSIRPDNLLLEGVTAWLHLQHTWCDIEDYE